MKEFIITFCLCWIVKGYTDFIEERYAKKPYRRRNHR